MLTVTPAQTREAYPSLTTGDAELSPHMPTAFTSYKGGRDQSAISGWFYMITANTYYPQWQLLYRNSSGLEQKKFEQNIGRVAFNWIPEIVRHDMLAIVLPDRASCKETTSWLGC